MLEGRAIIVDLTTKCTSQLAIDERTRSQYMGGSYLGTYLWLEYSRLEVDPLSPANTLVFAPGLLTGYPIIAANRTSVVAKSPLTGLLSESTVGGYFGPKLRSSGLDAIVLRGASPEPCYILVEGDDPSEVKLLPAGDLWGLDTFKTAETLKARHGGEVEVAAIGPAGENCVHFACITVGGADTRAAGRTGMGAVMGSKNVKAVVIRPGKTPRPKNSKELAEMMRDLASRIREKTQAFSAYGTAGGVISCEATGDLPIQNWKGGSFPGAARITGQAMAERGMVVGHYTCWGCPIRCGKDVILSAGDRAGQKSHGPEYETIAAFGSMCLNDDPDYVAAANDLANRLGLDTISAGNVIAFAIECFERGIISEDICGRPLRWGDGETILYLLEEIAHKRGIGRLLSRGVRAAAQSLGPLAQEFAVHVKGLEVPFHDPRAYTSMAVNYATCMRGACHLEGLTYYVESGTYSRSNLGIESEIVPSGTEGKAEVAFKMQNFLAAFNSLGLCKFLLRAQVTPDEIAGWVRTTFGLEMSGKDLLESGERLFNLRRLCNVALGTTRKDDILPPRLLSQPRPTGKAAGVLPHLGKMLDEYYKLRGWDHEGIPTISTLKRLNLLEFVGKLGISERVLSE
ncbi:MAG TPA: aldehyde ferredoxin oxidoreductase family protein [Firmicutes bacterium]|nr:aldehyde ferredoxin oxidoreductase family protein [Candidatus Fermentithermobacillaceae bacterium]